MQNSNNNFTLLFVCSELDMFFVEVEDGGPMILRAEIGSPQPSVDYSSPNGSDVFPLPSRSAMLQDSARTVRPALSENGFDLVKVTPTISTT